VISLPPRRLSFLLLLLAAPALSPEAAGNAAEARAARGNETLILDAPGGERTLPAVDLRFVFYERIYYRRHAPRSEEAKGERLDVEDRRRECRCLRLEDWSKFKFSKVRQIEIVYPPDGAVALLRVTELDGGMRELRADSLFGAVDSFAPRFAARIDGEVREFPLLLSERGSAWPEEKLVRLLLKRPPKRTLRH
jgi:hypothetical protein